MTKPIPWITSARWLGAIAVVLLHVSAQVMVIPRPAHPHTWLIATGFNSLTRWSVPVFVIISGYLAAQSWKLNQHSHQWYVSWLQRRWLSLGWPLLVWHTIYLWLWHQPPAGHDLGTWWLHLLISDQPFEHLYFLWVILELYLLAPLFFKLLKWADHDQAFIVVVLFGLANILPSSRWLATVWIPFAGYFGLGSYLALTPPKPTQRAWMWWIGWGSATLLAFGMVGWQTLQLQLTDNLAWFKFTHPIIVIQSYCFVRALMAIRRLKAWPYSTDLTLGLYLIHPLLVRAATPKLIGQPQHAFWLIPLVAGCIAVACALISWTIKHTPKLKQSI